MTPVFSPEGRAALDAVLALKPLLAFDFDGTLAPIVDEPDDARVPPMVALRLAQLAQRHPIAIVTGRSVADVSPRLGFTPRFIVGSHGAEDPAETRQSSWSAALDGLRARLAERADALGRAGVQAEDKQLSIALHFRRAPHQGQALQVIDELLVGLEPGLDIFGGKCVINVVSAGAPDKGDAVISLVRRAGIAAAVFVGDDINDEAVFAKAPAHWMTIRIGHGDAMSRAGFYVDSARQMVALLQAMLDTR